MYIRSPVGVLLCQLQTLKCLKCLSCNTTSSCGPVGRAGAIVAADSVNLLHCGDTNGRPDVHVAGHGCSTDRTNPHHRGPAPSCCWSSPGQPTRGPSSCQTS